MSVTHNCRAVISLRLRKLWITSDISYEDTCTLKAPVIWICNQMPHWTRLEVRSPFPKVILNWINTSYFELNQYFITWYGWTCAYMLPIARKIKKWQRRLQDNVNLPVKHLQLRNWYILSSDRLVDTSQISVYIPFIRLPLLCSGLVSRAVQITSWHWMSPIFITGCSGSCRSGYIRGSQWRKFIKLSPTTTD